MGRAVRGGVLGEGEGTQWRIKGTAFVVAPDIEGGEDKESSGVRTVKSEIGGRMRVVEDGEDKEGEWSWGRELTAHFGNCSPGMRGKEAFGCVVVVGI